MVKQVQKLALEQKLALQYEVISSPPRTTFDYLCMPWKGAFLWQLRNLPNNCRSGLVAVRADHGGNDMA